MAKGPKLFKHTDKWQDIERAVLATGGERMKASGCHRKYRLPLTQQVITISVSRGQLSPWEQARAKKAILEELDKRR